MLKIVMDDMRDGEVAVMMQEGENVVVIVSRHMSDDVRCDAVNDLLAFVKAQPQISGAADLRRRLVAVA